MEGHRQQRRFLRRKHGLASHLVAVDKLRQAQGLPFAKQIAAKVNLEAQLQGSHPPPPLGLDWHHPAPESPSD